MKFRKLAAAAMAATLVITSIPASSLAAVKAATGNLVLPVGRFSTFAQTGSNAKVSLKLDKTAVTLKMGDSADLEVTVATASDATPSDAVATPSNAVASASNAIEWKTDNAYVTVYPDDNTPTKAKVMFESYGKDAPETVTVTAYVENVEGVENAYAECRVTLSAPRLSVTANKKEFAYDEQAEITAKLTNIGEFVPDSDEFTYSVDGPAVVSVKEGIGYVENDGTGAYGKVVVSAIYGDNVADGSVELTLKQPTMAVAADQTTIDLKEKNQVKLEVVDNSYDYDEYTWSVDNDSVAGLESKGDTAVLTAKAAGTVIVTAAGVAGEGVKGASATRKITVKDSRKLAWKGETQDLVELYLNSEEKNRSETLEIINDFGKAQWTVEDVKVASVTASENGKTAVLTAKTAGSTTLKITAEGTDKELKLAVTVTNDGKLAWKEAMEGPVTLYLNNEEKNSSMKLEIINDFEDAKWTLADGKVAEIVPDKDGKSAVLTAKSAGSTTLTVTAEGAEEALDLTLIVIDSADKTVVESGETEVSVPQEVIDAVELPEIDTEGLTDEQKQYIEDNKSAIEASARKAVAEAVKSIVSNTAAKNIAVTGLDTVLKDAGLLEDGEKALVFLKQEVKEILVSTNVIVNEDGTVTVEPVITGIVFEITPHMANVDENGGKIDGTEANIADVINSQKRTVTLAIPVPAVGQSYAVVDHQGSKQTVKINKTKDGDYIKISANHFSEFVITFTDKAPVVSGGGGSGARAASVREYVPVEPGKWMLNETGWWYRYDNGGYPASQWVQLPWNGVNTWYHFDAQGYLTTGWFQDGGHTYYLHPYADGNRGYMYTGWHEIDGKWYYFHVMEGGPLGAMAVNMRTPDGFNVGADGVWIQ